jgi:sirohydrochlorin cobaltochelatase
MDPGVILFAHGARNARWAAPFEAVAARLGELQPDSPIRLAYLELMSPDLATAAQQLVAAGCSRITVVPLFLGAGGHVQRDLPALLVGLRQAHPAVRFEATLALGEMPSMLDAMARTIAAELDAAGNRR